MKKTLMILLAVCLVGGVALGKTIRFANIPAGTAEADVEIFGNILSFVESYVNERIDEPIDFEFVVADSYEAVILALKYDDVQMARLGPESYVIGAEQAPLIPIVNEIKKDTGQPYYNGIIIANKNTDVYGLAPCIDWSQYSFAFVTETSTSGYAIPMSIFREVGISPNDFKEVFYAGSHQSVILSVANGHTDLGATTYHRFNAAIESGAIDLNELRVIFVSDAVATCPIVVRSDFDAIPMDLLIEAWCAVPEDLAMPYQILGFLPTSDQDYDPIRALSQ